MQLRANVRRPGRYREEEVEDLPPNPAFVVPTILFNPNLRPAAFPTLQWNELGPDHPAFFAKDTVQEESSVEGESQESETEEGVRKERPAIVFRDNRTVPIMETEEGMVQLGDGTWLAMEDESDYDTFAGMWADDDVGGETEERWFLPAFSEQKYWSDLSNGMRLILVRELTAQMTFYDTVLFLQLGEKELEDFFDLCKQDIHIREVEDARVGRTHERQIAMMNSPDWNVGGDDWGRIFDEEVARMSEVKMRSTFLITREEVSIAKNYLGNFRFREELPEKTDRIFDEVDQTPSFATLSSIMDHLDGYIGVDTTFQELDFGQDFLEYLPEDVIVVEEVHDSESLETASEVPHQQGPVAAADPARTPPAVPPSTSVRTSKPPKEKYTAKKSTKKDNLTGMDVIGLDLIKKRPRGRPTKKDKIVKAGPTRLREVMNAEDIRSPSLAQSSPAIHKISASPTTEASQQPPVRPETPTPRKVSAVGRNPFKDHSPSTPPPAHCASFRDDLPAQPARTSPPKSSLSSPSCTVSEGAKATEVQVASVQAGGVELYYLGTSKATGAQDHYIFSTNSLAVPVPSMSRGVGTSSATLVTAPCISQGRKANSHAPSTMQNSQSTMSNLGQSTQSAPPKTSSASISGSGDPDTLVQCILDRMGHASQLSSQEKNVSAPTSNFDVFPSGVQATTNHVSTLTSYSKPPKTTSTSITNPDVHSLGAKITTSQVSPLAYPAVQKTTAASTSTLSAHSSSAQKSTSNASAPAHPSLPKSSPTFTPNAGVVSLGASNNAAPAHASPPKTISASKSISRPDDSSAGGQQDLATPNATQLLLPQALLGISIPKPQPTSLTMGPQSLSCKPPPTSNTSPAQVLSAASVPTLQPAASSAITLQALARSIPQTTQPSSPYVSPYKPDVAPPKAALPSPSLPKVDGSPAISAAPSLEQTPKSKVSTADGQLPSPSKPTPKISLAHDVVPSQAKVARKIPSVNVPNSSSSKPTPKLSPPNTSPLPPKPAPKNEIPPAAALPQFNKQVTPGRLKFNTKGPQGSPHPTQANASAAHLLEASVKRPRDEEITTHLPEEQRAKKPRIGQSEEPKNSFMNKVKGGMRAVSNMLTGSKDAAVKPSRINSSDIADDSNERSATQSATPGVAVPISHLGTVNKLEMDEVTPGEFNHLDRTAGSQDLPMTDGSPFNNEGTVGNPQDLAITDSVSTPSLFNQPSVAENVSTETPKTPTKASRSNINLPAKRKKANRHEEEASKVAGQALLQQFAAQATKAVDESKILGSLPPILAQKTRSGAEHVRTNNRSSVDSVGYSRTTRVKTSTPGPSSAAGPTILQEVTAEGFDESKKLRAPSAIVAEKTRSATKHRGTNSQSSTESIGNLQARTFTPEPSMTETPSQRRKSTIKVQIPASKRAASELLAPSFEREGSLAKKLKISKASSSTTSGNDATQANTSPHKRGAHAQTAKKPVAQPKDTSSRKAISLPNDISRNGEASSSAASADISVTPGPAKKGCNGKKAATTTKPAPPAKATPAKHAPKSKVPAQPKGASQTRTTKATAAKPKVTPKAKVEKVKPSGTRKKGFAAVSDEADA